MKRGLITRYYLFTLVLLFVIVFISAISYNVSPSVAGNGTTISLLIFNVSNAGTTNNVLTSITVNLTGTVGAGNITNVTLSSGANVYYNTSGVAFPLVIPVSATITAAANYTLNFTISSSATDSLTMGANVTAISAGANVSYDTLPYNSSLVTISSLPPSITFNSGTSGLPTNNSNLSQTFIFINITANETASNVSRVSINIYNSTTFNSTFLVNSSINSSVNQQSVTQTLNSTNLPNGVFYVNIFSNDTFNHQYNQTYTVTLDTVAPTVGGSCSPSTVFPGQAVTCSCSASGTYNSSTLTNSSTITAGGPGVYSYGCSATDYAGNIGTGSASYSVLGYPGPAYVPSSKTSSPSPQNNQSNSSNNTGSQSYTPSVPQHIPSANIFTAIAEFFARLFKAIFG